MRINAYMFDISCECFFFYLQSARNILHEYLVVFSLNKYL